MHLYVVTIGKYRTVNVWAKSAKEARELAEASQR
jgi:hypothetical protein